ncbi:MAG: alpha/beta hydrolase [Pseudomonadota bacterium]
MTATDLSEIDYAAEYDNSGRVENSDQLIDAYIDDAANFRETEGLIAEYGLVYGPKPRNQMDIFWPDEERNQNIVLFIHGGYWQRMDRSSFSHMAQGLLGQNLAVAMPSYSLCPDISVEGIINEMRRACLVLYQTYKHKLTVVGHSAGGHLAACLMATDWLKIHPALPDDLVTAGMGISGLYDLQPLIQTPINDALGMDLEHAKKSSPIDWMPDGLHRFEAWVGEDESNEYHRQSRELATRWSMLGTPTSYISVTDANHFTIINQLTEADSAMVEMIVELVNQPTALFELTPPDIDDLNIELQDFATPVDETTLAQTVGISEHEPASDDKNGQTVTRKKKTKPQKGLRKRRVAAQSKSRTRSADKTKRAASKRARKPADNASAEDKPAKANKTDPDTASPNVES